MVGTGADRENRPMASPVALVNASGPDLASSLGRILADHFGVPEESIEPSTALAEDLGGDSLDALELVCAIEEELDVDLPLGAARLLRTLSDAETLVRERSGREDRRGEPILPGWIPRAVRPRRLRAR